MADKEGPQAPAPQGTHDPLALQNPPPPLVPQTLCLLKIHKYP